MREEKFIDIYHWHNLSLSYTSQFGSLELNLHFKHDFKNTLLWFPPKQTPGSCGEKLLCVLETDSVLRSTGPAGPRGELREGQVWLSPCL